MEKKFDIEFRIYEVSGKGKLIYTEVFCLTMPAAITQIGKLLASNSAYKSYTVLTIYTKHYSQP